MLEAEALAEYLELSELQAENLRSRGQARSERRAESKRRARSAEAAMRRTAMGPLENYTIEEKSVAKGDKMEAPQPAPTIDESTGLPEEEAKQGDEGVVSPQSFPIGAKVRIHVSRLKRKFDGQLAEVESVGQKFVKVRMLTGPSMTETKQFLPTCIKLEEPVKAAETEKTSAASTAAQRAEAMFGKCDDI